MIVRLSKKKKDNSQLYHRRGKKLYKRRIITEENSKAKGYIRINCETQSTHCIEIKKKKKQISNDYKVNHPRETSSEAVPRINLIIAKQQNKS